MKDMALEGPRFPQRKLSALNLKTVPSRSLSCACHYCEVWIGTLILKDTRIQQTEDHDEQSNTGTIS